MRSRLALAVALASAVVAVVAAGAASAPIHDGMLYGCVYVENLGNSSNLDVLVWDKHAPHAHAWAMISGGGLNQTDKFTLDQHGWHTEKFNVTSFGDYKFTVGIIKPKLSYSFDFTLSAANDITGKSCKPH